MTAPIATPAMAARPKPTPTRSSEVRTRQPRPIVLRSSHIERFKNQIAVLLQISSGEGNAAPPPESATCHIASRQVITRTCDNTLFRNIICAFPTQRLRGAGGARGSIFAAACTGSGSAIGASFGFNAVTVICAPLCHGLDRQAVEIGLRIGGIEGLAVKEGLHPAADNVLDRDLAHWRPRHDRGHLVLVGRVLAPQHDVGFLVGDPARKAASSAMTVTRWSPNAIRPSTIFSARSRSRSTTMIESLAIPAVCQREVFARMGAVTKRECSIRQWNGDPARFLRDLVGAASLRAITSAFAAAAGQLKERLKNPPRSV